MSLRRFALSWRASATRCAAAALLLVTPAAPADEAQTRNLWLTWSGTARLAGAWGVSNEITARSTDGWGDIRSLEIRPGLTYAWSPVTTLSGGVSYIQTYQAGPGPDTHERRLWVQGAWIAPIRRARVTNRLRVEERFIERSGRPEIDATRLRWQTRALVPLASGADASFRQGGYAVLQQELMAHVTGASQLNGHALDQFRLAAGIGRRFDPSTDLEVIYLHQLVSGRTADTHGHIVQLTLTTRF